MTLRAKKIGVVQLGISTPNVLISNPHKFLKVQIIESVQCEYNLEGKLWESKLLAMSALYQYPWYELSI